MSAPIRIVDSHTGGEPTRVVIAGGPPLGGGPLARRRERFKSGFDRYRTAVIGEPRSAPAMVGALLTEPESPGALAGVIFFNNAGYLGMCGHGAIGVIATLAELGRIAPGIHRLDTPVGPVEAELHDNGEVTIGNVPSRRAAKGVRVRVDGHGEVAGDVAWGGNWFFLTEGAPAPLEVAHAPALLAYTSAIRRALARAGIAGDDGIKIDHVECCGPPRSPDAHGRNFVLCPGGEYDRSPCGTGTSAKLACLHADGKLRPGERWIQESVTGSRFTGRVEVENGIVRPFITGRAFVNGTAELKIDGEDPFRWGIP